MCIRDSHEATLETFQPARFQARAANRHLAQRVEQDVILHFVGKHGSVLAVDFELDAGRHRRGDFRQHRVGLGIVVGVTGQRCV